jgi:hypothetical protein
VAVADLSEAGRAAEVRWVEALPQVGEPVAVVRSAAEVLSVVAPVEEFPPAAALEAARWAEAQAVALRRAVARVEAIPSMAAWAEVRVVLEARVVLAGTEATAASVEASCSPGCPSR